MKWSALPSRLVATMLSGHLALGLAASALLYVLCVSGTAMVFHQEFERWEQPAVPEFASVPPASAQRAAESVLARLDGPPHHFYVGLPSAAMPRLWVADDERAWWFDRDGGVVVEADNDFSHLLERLHYYLTLPTFAGLTLVGILGVLMVALCLGGVLAHPRLFRDAFRLRVDAGARLRQADWHNRLGVWGLPFHLVIATTGAAIGLSLLVAATLSPVVNDGDSASFFAPVFGAEADGDETPAPLPDLVRAIGELEAKHPEAEGWFFSIHHAGTVGQETDFAARHPRRLIYGENYAVDADGAITNKLGLSDGPLGQQLFASLYPLHFGSFGGLPVKIAYGLLGLAACVVSASGFSIWLTRRRQRRRALPAMERAWTGVVWGTPLVLVLVMLFDLLAGPGLAALVAAFWILLAAVLLVAVALPRRLRREQLQGACAAGLVLAVALHLLVHGGAAASGAALGINATLLLLAAWTAWLASRGRRAARATLAGAVADAG